MNVIDIVILLALVMSVFNGLRQGLIAALANLIGWIMAFVLGIRYHNDVESYLGFLTRDPSILSILSFAFIVIVVMIIAWSASHLLQSAFKRLKLSWLNRLAGGFFGIAKVLVVFLILIHILSPWLSNMTLWKSSNMIALLHPYAAVTTLYSQEVVQKTTEKLDSVESDKNNLRQNAILHDSTQDTKRQVENPFL